MEEKSSIDYKFDSIYQAYADSIFKMTMHYAKDYDVAQEITQAAFFQLYTHFKNVDLEYVKPWLVTTAKHLLFNYNRDSKREILGEVLELVMESTGIPEYGDTLEEDYLRKHQKNMAKDLRFDILERLYREHRVWYDAVKLVYCLNKSQLDAAEELGIAIEVLHSRLYRARQWIRKNYGKEYEEVVNWF